MFASAKELIEKSGPIASLPEVFYRVNEAVDDPECSFSSIAHIIAKDSALSARLLKIVNSPFYGFDTRIETVTHAITIIGMAQLRDLILATLVVDKFRGLAEKSMNMKSFWTHNIACGLMARIIATFCHERAVERFYVMGLIHDIGRLIMFLAIPEQMSEIIQTGKLERKLLHTVEKERLGFDHSEVGYLLIQAWRLPDIFQVAVLHCHDLNYDHTSNRETAIIHISDIVVHSLDLGCNGENYVPTLNPSAWEKVGLSASMIPLMIKQLDRELDGAMEIFI